MTDYRVVKRFVKQSDGLRTRYDVYQGKMCVRRFLPTEVEALDWIQDRLNNEGQRRSCLRCKTPIVTTGYRYCARCREWMGAQHDGRV